MLDYMDCIHIYTVIQQPEPLNKYGVLGPDCTGLESSLVESADKCVGPALLNEATRGSGGDGASTGGSWGTELDPVVPTLFPNDGPVSGVGMKHRAWCRPRRGREDGARPAKRRMPRPKRERGSDRMVGSQKLEAISLGVTPATKRMAASIMESKARKTGRLASSRAR